MQAMNRFVEYFGAYMDEAGRLALADAAVVGMSTYHDRRELHIALQLPALVETAELERCADQIAAQMGLEKAVLTSLCLGGVLCGLSALPNCQHSAAPCGG